jgi:hypothetical protein
VKIGNKAQIKDKGIYKLMFKDGHQDNIYHFENDQGDKQSYIYIINSPEQNTSYVNPNIIKI